MSETTTSTGERGGEHPATRRGPGGASPPSRSRKLAHAIAILAIAASAGALATPVAAQRLKLATLAPEGSSWHRILGDTANAWKQASGGRVRLVIFPAGVAGDDREVVEKMRAGVLQAAALSAVGLGEIDDSVYALSVPMMYSSYDELYCVLDGLRPRLEASLAERGFVVLHWADGGWIRFFTRVPVTTPDDLRRLDLFTWDGDADATDLWRSAGFRPVPLPVTEIFRSLESGSLGALGTPPQVAVISQFYDHVRNMTDLRWQLMLGATVVTRAAWDGIPADLQPRLLAAARESGERLRRAIRDRGERDVEAMRERGLNVVSVDAASRSRWQEVAEGLYPEIRGRIVPADAFDEAMRLRDAYRRAEGGACSF